MTSLNKPVEIGINNPQAQDDKQPLLVSTDTDLGFKMLANPDKMKIDEKQMEKPTLIQDANINMLCMNDATVPRDKNLFNADSIALQAEDSEAKELHEFMQVQGDTKLTNIELIENKEECKKDAELKIPKVVSNQKLNQQPEVEKPKFKFDPTHDETPIIDNSPEALLAKKYEMLKNIGELKRAGIQISEEYDVDSDLSKMTAEYNFHSGIRNKDNAIKVQKSILMTSVAALEYLNDSYNPFDFKLKGWAEQVNHNLNDFDDVFGELYDKYKDKGGKIAPEIKLVMLLTGGAINYHLKKTLFPDDAQAPATQAVQANPTSRPKTPAVRVDDVPPAMPVRQTSSVPTPSPVAQLTQQQIQQLQNYQKQEKETQQLQQQLQQQIKQQQLMQQQMQQQYQTQVAQIKQQQAIEAQRLHQQLQYHQQIMQQRQLMKPQTPVQQQIQPQQQVIPRTVPQQPMVQKIDIQSNDNDTDTEHSNQEEFDELKKMMQDVSNVSSQIKANNTSAKKESDSKKNVKPAIFSESKMATDDLSPEGKKRRQAKKAKIKIDT